MSEILRYDRKRDDLIELAVLDESPSYEVDITEIHYDPNTKEYVLLTAIGCSCWGGEYDEERFKTLKQLGDSILREERKYNPSFTGAQELITEAKQKIKGGALRKRKLNAKSN